MVDGTPDGLSTSDATSIDAEEDSAQSHATLRYHFEHLAVPATQGEQPWPSASSFNASVDRLEQFERREDGVDGDSHPPPAQQQTANGKTSTGQYLGKPSGIDPSSPGHPSPPLLDNIDGPSDHPLDDTNSHPTPTIRNSETRPNYPVIIHQDIPSNPAASSHDDSSTILQAQQPPNPLGLNPNPTPSQGTSAPSASLQPSVSTTATPNPSPVGPMRHPHRRRRRLLRWLQRHFVPPMPWGPSPRRRAANVRRSIQQVNDAFPGT
ncbi:MAG: hypothetical protein Q9220_006237 [cf. Caloplaca sp. 1 TL-2023]